MAEGDVVRGLRPLLFRAAIDEGPSFVGFSHAGRHGGQDVGRVRGPSAVVLAGGEQARRGRVRDVLRRFF